MAFQRSFALLGAAALFGSAVFAQPALAATVLTYEEQKLAVGDTVTVSPLTTPDHCEIFLEWGSSEGLNVTVEDRTGSVTVKVVAPQEDEYLVNVACGDLEAEPNSLRFGGVPVTIVDDSNPSTDDPVVEDEDDQDADPVDEDEEKDGEQGTEEKKNGSLADLLGSSDLPRVFAGSSLR